MQYNTIPWSEGVFCINSVDNMLSKKVHNHLYSAEESPPMFQPSNIMGNTRKSLAADKTPDLG